MSSGSRNPLFNYNPSVVTIVGEWDVVTIGGAVCPGHCEIRGFERNHGWDKKTGKGSLGTTVTFKNKPAVEGSIMFYLYTGLHFQLWESFRPRFLYDPTKRSVSAIDIFHPSLADLGIKSVVTESIAPIRHMGENLYGCEVKLIEYIPPPKLDATATPAGSSSGQGTNKNPPAPTDPLQQKVAALFKQFQATP